MDTSSFFPDVIKIGCGVLLISLASFVQNPVVFLGSPSTMQMVAVIGTAISLGPSRACMSVFIFLLLGMFGLPVLPRTPSAQFAMFTYWYLGVCVGYFLAVCWTPKLSLDEVAQLGARKLWSIPLVPLILLLLPHSVWIALRLVPEAVMIMLVQAIVGYLVLGLSLLLVRSLVRRRRVSGQQVTSPPA